MQEPVRKRAAVAARWDGLSDVQQELEFRRCQKDFVFFCENYFTIKVPGRGQTVLRLRDAQRETAAVWMEKRFSITLKARQIGFSTLVNALAAWHVWFHDDREIILLSKTGLDARKLLEGVKYAWTNLPELMRERVGGVRRLTIDTFEMSNGSIIRSLNSNNPARGYSGFLIFVDEAAFFENFDQAWAAIEPAADVGGRIHLLSTANGVGNGFHEMWTKAVARVSDYVPIFHSWRAGGRDDAWYEAKSRQMPDWQLHQEYPSSPEEAFIRSGRPVFDLADDWGGVQPKPPAHQGWLDGYQLVEADDGPLCVWERPKAGERYVIGADVSEGLSHGDFSACHVIHSMSGVVVARWRGHVDLDEFGEIVVTLGKLYNSALIGWEVNSIGASLTQYFKRARYPNLYRRVKDDERTDLRLERLGWHTTKVTKPVAIEELRQALRDGDVVLHDETTLGELRTFVRLNDKGSMGGQPFDDCVMSLAIAHQMRRWWVAAQFRASPSTAGTWAEMHAKMRARNAKSWVIGERCKSERMNSVFGLRR